MKECNYETPPAERARERAIDRHGRGYGWWCCSGKHVWTDREDARKCCDPAWRRCLNVGPHPLGDGGAVYHHYWERA